MNSIKLFMAIIIVIASVMLASTIIYAGNDGTAPEASSFKVHDGNVDASFTGDLSFSLPLYTITGRGVDLPIVLTYQAGITDNIANEPGWVGDGFSLGFGSVTRSVSGTPDEYVRSTSSNCYTAD